MFLSMQCRDTRTGSSRVVFNTWHTIPAFARRNSPLEWVPFCSRRQSAHHFHSVLNLGMALHSSSRCEQMLVCPPLSVLDSGLGEFHHDLAPLAQRGYRFPRSWSTSICTVSSYFRSRVCGHGNDKNNTTFDGFRQAQAIFYQSQTNFFQSQTILAKNG